MEFTAEAIAAYLGGTVEGNAQAKVCKVTKIEEGEAGSLAFLSNPKYEHYIYSTAASVVIVSNDFEPKSAMGATLVRVENPYISFARLLELYVANKPCKSGLSDRASIAQSATLGEGVYVGAFAVIEQGVQVGDNTKIYPQVYLGDGVRIGRNCTINAGVKIYEQCVIGDNVTLHSGVVVGGDGFGFAPTDGGVFTKIQQIGNVVIGDDVEIGANTCIDRATMGSTVIGKGVKLDNLIQIAHNVVVGENTVIAAQCGIAGSTHIGSNVMMGGQVGVVGHLNIADGVKIGSQSGVNHKIDKQGAVLLGTPAIDGLIYHRAHAIFKDLPALRAKLFDISRRVDKIENPE